MTTIPINLNNCGIFCEWVLVIRNPNAIKCNDIIIMITIAISY